LIQFGEAGQVVGDRGRLAPREATAEIGLDQLGQQDDRFLRAGFEEALLFPPQALQRDITVPSPLILEQLHGVVHALESAPVADRGDERFHGHPPEPCIESSSLLRKRWTRRIFQPVCSAISALEYPSCLSLMMVLPFSSSTLSIRRSCASLATAHWLAVGSSEGSWTGAVSAPPG